MILAAQMTEIVLFLQPGLHIINFAHPHSLPKTRLAMTSPLPGFPLDRA
jgi:hypothetical protein